VFDYAIGKVDAPGYETFHAKVVLADRDAAYVGSSNMNKASKERSMELGLVVQGRAAQQIARALDSIMRVADSVRETGIS
jgi:phosphatidylserine/phosphatidylglycerophosphate/cardiolipin synthase-like enzyme